MIPEYNFLDALINELGVSEAFKEKSNELGFKRLRQITDIGWGALLKMDNFSYTWFNELVRFLKERGALHLLETDQP